jgi:hypothetical protein
MKLKVAITFRVLGCLVSVCAFGQSTCVNFPAGFIPFSSISYVTAANSAGDHLVVGVPAPGSVTFITANIPLPTFTNQTFCDAQVQLAPQQYYPNVYVPTALEAEGNFSAFAGLLVNPTNSQSYPGGVIPISQLNNVFAWRIGAAQATSALKGWSPTGSMAQARYGAAAVLLPSGKVLVVGGYSATSGVATAEIYDPAPGAFSTAGKTQFEHGAFVTATLLNNGTVLIEGGDDAPSSAELYDPVSNRFTPTGTTIQPHGFYQTATLLLDGRVLVVGGLAAAGGAATTNAGAEIYDPHTGTFASAGPMNVNRREHIATLLADGRVLVAGGATGPLNTGPVLDTTEIYDPSSGFFSVASPMQVARNRFFAVLLSSGKVLCAGGPGISTAELFDPTTNRFGLAGVMNTSHAELPGVALLSNGQVLVGGGDTPFPSWPSPTMAAELYYPTTSGFSLTGNMDVARTLPTATLLLDGRVLFTGGYAGGGNGVCCTDIQSSAELYTPVTEGLVTSQTGLTFRVAQGGATVPPQSIAVLSATATIPWTLSTDTYQGGNWLSVTPTSGTSSPTTAPIVLSITVNPDGLASQDYYGAVTLAPTDGTHPPISIAIVLSIVPAGATAPPGVTPNGLLFLPAIGATPGAQSFTISNLTSKPLTFTAAGSATPS